jgi:hypothetical protein
MICAELRLKTVGRLTELCCHHAGIGDDDVERFRFREQLFGAFPDAFEIGQINFDQLETATVSRSVLTQPCGRGLSLGLVPGSPHNVRAMGGQ